MSNFPGPYEVRFRYTVTPTGLPTLEHVHKLNCDLTTNPLPGEDLANVRVKLRNGSDAPLVDSVQNYMNLVRAWWPVSTDLFAAELWKYALNSFDATFINAIAASSVGTSGFAAVHSQTSILTFRTIEGGVMKLQYMETFVTAVVRESPPFANTVTENIADFVVSSGNWILARDTSYPIAVLHHLPSQSEAIFKKRFRNQ